MFGDNFTISNCCLFEILARRPCCVPNADILQGGLHVRDCFCPSGDHVEVCNKSSHYWTLGLEFF